MTSSTNRNIFVLTQKETDFLNQKICMLRWIIKAGKGATLNICFTANLIGLCILNI